MFVSYKLLHWLHIALFLLIFPSNLFGFEGWIDPDTLPENKIRKSYSDGLDYDIVMSDEFNRPGRTFKDGDDPMWTGDKM